MTTNWENLCFRVEMIEGSSSVGASYKSETLVLYHLETFDGGWRVVGIYDGSRIVEERPYQRFEGQCEALLIVAKGSVRQCPEHV